MKTSKVPKDLGLKVCSKRESFLKGIKERLQEDNITCENTIDLNTLFIDTLNKAIDVEKEKFK